MQIVHFAFIKVIQLLKRMFESKKLLRRKKGKEFAASAAFPWKVLKRYLLNSSIHGVRYLVEDRRHFSERVFWMICCGLSWWGCFLMVNGVLMDFSMRQVATTVDTNYLHSKAELPSIHICFTQSAGSDEFIKKTWGRISGPVKMYNFMTYGYNTRLNEPHDAETLAKFSNTIPVRCEKVFETCKWNDKALNCCAIFRPLWTTVGHCHSFNSQYTRSSDPSVEIEDKDFFVRQPHEPGVFIVRFANEVDFKKGMSVYLLNQVSLPAITTASESKLPSDMKNQNLRLDITSQPTFNEEGVRLIDIDKRHCRFPDETENYMYYKRYSYDVCYTEAILKAMLNSCGCICHLYPRTANMKVCDQKGLACIAQSAQVASVTTNITCMADCEENTYDMNKLIDADGPKGELHVHLLPGPTLSYRRYVVHNKLDLVVAVGSAIGLFVGASILSVVELPYWLIIRSFDNDDDNEDINRESAQQNY